MIIGITVVLRSITRDSMLIIIAANISRQKDILMLYQFKYKSNPRIYGVVMEIALYCK